MTRKEIQNLISQHFIIGFRSPHIKKDCKDFLSTFPVGGIIYFKENIESPFQIAELSYQLQTQHKAYNDTPNYFICVDHEGGRVHRFPQPFTHFPPMSALSKNNSPTTSFLVGETMAYELKAVGINMNFAPVVDIAAPDDKGVIGDRSFSSHPEVVANLASGFCRGLQKNNIIAVAKHFPGHGGVAIDSHFALPSISKSWADLEKHELIPFRKVIKSQVKGIMTAHIKNPLLDEKYPATLSQPTLAYVRNTLRFQNLIISDDLEMKAISAHYDPNEAALYALQAGCTMLIYKNETIDLPSIIRFLVECVQKNELPLTLLENNALKILSLKQTYCTIEKPNKEMVEASFKKNESQQLIQKILA